MIMVRRAKHWCGHAEYNEQYIPMPAARAMYRVQRANITRMMIVSGYKGDCGKNS
jgi:hypothetical protein